MRGNKWCAVYRREDRRGVLSVARSDYKDEIRVAGGDGVRLRVTRCRYTDAENVGCTGRAKCYVVKTKAPLRGSPFRCCLSNITFVLDNSSFNANAHGIFV